MKRLNNCMSAVLLVCGIGWQSAAQGLPAEKSPPSAPPATSQKSKKVWTNEDLAQLRDSRGVSVVGKQAQSKSTPNEPAGTPPKYVKEKDPAWYREQLDPMRERIIEIDEQIRELGKYRSAADYAVDGMLLIPQLAGLPLNPQDQIKNLKLQRSAITRKIDALKDLARRNEILPGDIR